MKQRVLLFIVIGSLLGVVGCAKTKRWSEHERRAVRDEVRAYRNMAYLDNLEDVEFDIFSTDVVDAIEVDYPVYTTFVELPSRGDTVEVYVVQTIVSELRADAHNMRKLYPYRELVAEGILPSDLDRQAQRAFYECFARRVEGSFPSVGAFYNAVVADTTSNSKIMQLQRQCASDLFDWVVEVDEVILYP